MSQQELVSVAGLPRTLRWYDVPQKWGLDSGSNLTMTAGQHTDWFIDPEGKRKVLNAPALLMKTNECCLLKACITVEYASTFDAGVLVVYENDQTWAKLCLELSPERQLFIVSVVTNGASDDCNSLPISGGSAYLRLAKMERAYAFHFSPDGRRWNLIRHFTLGGLQAVDIGFLVQSPTGDGCTANFQEISYLPQELNDIRSGA